MSGTIIVLSGHRLLQTGFARKKIDYMSGDVSHDPLYKCQVCGRTGTARSFTQQGECRG